MGRYRLWGCIRKQKKKKRWNGKEKQEEQMPMSDPGFFHQGPSSFSSDASFFLSLASALFLGTVNSMQNQGR